MNTPSLTAEGLGRRWQFPPDDFPVDSPTRGEGNPTGKAGKLELTAVRGGDGSTHLKRSESRNPLAIQRRLVPESNGQPSRVCVVTPGGGLLGGDRHERSVHCQRGSYLRVEDTGLQRVYGMKDKKYCRQSTRITVESGACLEWIPGPVIPYADSCLHEYVQLELRDDAALFLPFVLMPGRLAHGENGDYEYYGQRVLGRNPGRNQEHGSLSDLRFADSLTVGRSVGSTPDQTLSTIYILLENDERHNRLIEQLRTMFEREPDLRGGVSLLGDDRTVVVHLTASDWRNVLEYIRKTYVQFRKEMKFSTDPEAFLFTTG